MKNLLLLFSLVIAVIFFIGCGGGGDNPPPAQQADLGPAIEEDEVIVVGDMVDDVNVVNLDINTLYLAYNNEIADPVQPTLQGVDYACGSSTGQTDENGGFFFSTGDNCTIDMSPFAAPGYVSKLYIIDAEGNGIAGLEYTCWPSERSDVTDDDGSFNNYRDGDACTFSMP